MPLNQPCEHERRSPTAPGLNRVVFDGVRADQRQPEIGDTLEQALQRRLVAEVDQEFERTRTRARRGGILEQPSPAELTVLRLLPTDLSMRQIGAQLFLSPNTVHTHTRAIYRKLGVASRAQAVARATTRGLLDESRSPG